MRKLLCVAFCLLVFGSAAFTQEQKEPPTVRDYCVKVAPGKGCTSAKGRFRKEGGIFCVSCRIIYGRRIKAWTISPRQFLLASHN